MTVQEVSVEKTTDDDLARLISSGDDTPSPEKEKEADVEEKKKELPPDHAERSEFGRKANERLTKLEEGVNTILQRINDLSTSKKQDVVEEDIPEVITTPEDVRKVFKHDRENQIKVEREYAKNYNQTFRKLGEDDPDLQEDPKLYQEIYDRMFKDFNIARLDKYGSYLYGPDVDAEINYAKAKAAVLLKKVSPTKANVRGKKSELSADLGIESRQPPDESSVDIELDPLTIEFMASQGMKKEDLKGLKR